jgi:hypothetical protein
LRVRAAVARMPARSRTGMGRRHHCHAAIAAPAPAPTSPRRPPPPSACSFEPATRGKPREAIVWRPDTPAPPSPPARPRRTAVALRDFPSNTLGHLQNRGRLIRTRGTTHRCGRSRSGRIRCGPPLISQATHRPSRQQAAPPATGSHAAANGRPATAPTAGVQAAPAIRGSRAAGPD